MKFVKPELEIVERSKYQSMCGCWKAYTNPLIGRLYWRKLIEIFDFLKFKKWDLILEIGCGYGYFLPSLCKISRKVIGSDIKEMFDFCKKTTLAYIKRSCQNLELRKADVRELSNFVEENSCDVIVAISVLEHVVDIDKSIIEMRKCLKPRGLLACVLPTENWLYKAGRLVVGYKGDYHQNYELCRVRSSLCKTLQEVEMWHFPFRMPIFFAGVYQRNE